MAKKETPVEVEIRDERIIPIFRGMQPTAHQIIVTYLPLGVVIPRTLFVVVEDVFTEEAEEFLKQLAVKKGPLYDRWVEVRAVKIREDIAAREAFKPERVKV